MYALKVKALITKIENFLNNHKIDETNKESAKKNTIYKNHVEKIDDFMTAYHTNEKSAPKHKNLVDLMNNVQKKAAEVMKETRDDRIQSFYKTLAGMFSPQVIQDLWRVAGDDVYSLAAENEKKIELKDTELENLAKEKDAEVERLQQMLKTTQGQLETTQNQNIELGKQVIGLTEQVARYQTLRTTPTKAKRSSDSIERSEELEPEAKRKTLVPSVSQTNNSNIPRVSAAAASRFSFLANDSQQPRLSQSSELKKQSSSEGQLSEEELLNKYLNISRGAMPGTAARIEAICTLVKLCNNNKEFTKLDKDMCGYLTLRFILGRENSINEIINVLKSSPEWNSLSTELQKTLRSIQAKDTDPENLYGKTELKAVCELYKHFYDPKNNFFPQEFKNSVVDGKDSLRASFWNEYIKLVQESGVSNSRPSTSRPSTYQPKQP